MEKLTISVIVPVYQVEQCVGRCVQSIMEQDGCGAHVECVFVDDCSPDNSMSVIHSLTDGYQGDVSFLFLRHERNRGVSAARNTGIDAASGDYILFVDSDDWLYTGALSKFVKTVGDNPDADMVSGKLLRRIPDVQVTPQLLVMDGFQLRKCLLNYQKEVVATATNKLLKTSIVVRNKFMEGIIYEDTPWTYFLFRDVAKTVIIPDITYVYENDRPSSISNTARTRQKALSYVDSVCMMGNAVLDAPYEDLLVDTFFFMFHHLFVALRLQHDCKLSDEDCVQLKRLRKRFVVQPLKAGRCFTSFFFFLLTYPPTTWLFNVAWVRRHYDPIEETGRKMAHFFERFHSKKHSSAAT